MAVHIGADHKLRHQRRTWRLSRCARVTVRLTCWAKSPCLKSGCADAVDCLRGADKVWVDRLSCRRRAKSATGVRKVTPHRSPNRQQTRAFTRRPLERRSATNSRRRRRVLLVSVAP